MSPIKERLNDRQKELLQMGSAIWTDLQGKGNTLLVGLQERNSTLVDRGQTALEGARSVSTRAIGTFEGNFLTKAAGLLDWAYTATGERSDFIQKGRDFVAERVSEQIVEKDDVEIKTCAEKPTQEVAAEVEPPFNGYDDLSAKNVVSLLEGLGADVIKAVEQYESNNKARKTVISAVVKMLTPVDPPATSETTADATSEATSDTTVDSTETAPATKS